METCQPLDQLDPESQKALAELKTTPRGQEAIGNEETIISIARETFQSSTFISNGFCHMPERYGEADRLLYIIERDSGEKTIITVGKVSNGNPASTMIHAVVGGLDLRDTRVVIYQCNGNGVIKEYLPDDKGINTYNGNDGDPDFLLECLSQSLSS